MLTEVQREICKDVFDEFDEKSTEFILSICADRTGLGDNFLDIVESDDWIALGFEEKK